MPLYESIPLDSPIQVIEAERLESNPLISKVQIKIAYPEFNRNGSHISKEVMQQMAEKSLRGTPIVGHYVYSKGDFADHSIKTEMASSGKVEDIRLTKPYGFIHESAQISWQAFKDEDGEEREYLVTEGFLWTGRYPESMRVLEEGNNQSMEIDENSVKGHWVEHTRNGDRVFVITEANFSALCILGVDVEPAFEGASITSTDFSRENALKEGLAEMAEKEYDRELKDFRESLEYALKHEFNEKNVPIKVIEIDTEEQLDGVKHAVDELDSAAEIESSEESQKAIDSAIDTLLDVEKKLDIEDQVVATTPEGQESLEEMTGEPGDILSSPNYEKVKPITTPFEEEEEMTEEERKALEEQKAAEGKEEVVVTAPVEEAPVQSPAPVVEEEVPAPERVSAEEKRKNMSLDGLSDEELLETIIQRMESAENVKSRIEDLFGGNTEVEVSAEDEKEMKMAEREETETLEGETVEKTEEAPMTEEDEKEKEDYANLGKVTQDRKEEGGSKATPEVPEGNSTPDVSKGEATPTTPDVEEGQEKTTGTAPEGATGNSAPKKDKNIRTYELEVADLSKQLIAMSKENAELKEQNKALSEFKLGIEKEEKETMLNSFSLLDEESKEAIRAEFSLLSVEDVEAKCAVAYYRKGLVGQNSTADESVVSYNLESQDNTPGWVKALRKQ